MALRVLTTNGTYTTGTWYRAEAYSLDYSVLAVQDALNVERTLAVTFANAGNQMGIFLPLTVTAAGTSDTVTVKLQEYVGSVWTTRTTDTFAVNNTTFPGAPRGVYHYLALTSYGVTAAASTWRYAISTTTANISWCRSSTAGDYGYAVFLDANSGKPSSGDSLVLKGGCTYTIDQSQTWGAIESNRAIFMCDTSIITWPNPGSSPNSYTFTLSGSIEVAYEYQFLIGSEADPISVANRATIDLTNDAAAALFANHYNGYTNRSRGYVKFWGAESNYLSIPIASNAAAGQKDIVLTQDMSAIWSAGDVVTIVGKNLQNSDTATYTIASMAGTTITLNVNLDYIAFANGRVQNLTEADQLGIKITTSGAAARYLGSTAYFSPLTVECAGIHAYLFGFSNGTGYVLQSNEATTANRYLFRSVFLQMGTVASRGIYIQTYNSIPSILTNCHVYLVANTYSYPFGLVGNQIAVSNISGKNVFYKGVIVIGNLCTLSEMSWGGGCDTSITGANSNLDFSGVAGSLSNIYLFGNRATAANITAYYATINNLQIEKTGTYGLMLGNLIGCTLTNCNFGNVYPAGTNDVFLTANCTIVSNFNNCSIGSGGVSATSLTASSFTNLAWDTYDRVANDHRSYLYYGNFQSSGDGLSDTTVHTSGASKFALRLEPKSSVNNLAWIFFAPTGNIQNQTMTVAVWCKINNAAYYAGTHEKPRLTINYDNGTVVYAEATATTAWQLLAVSFVPTTTYGQITITLSGRTDATGSNSYIYWDDFAVLYPAGYKLDLGGMDLWANALPITPPIATVLSAMDVWTASDLVDYGANTMGEKVKDYIEQMVTTLVQDGAVYQFTANALELGAAGSGLTAQQVRDALKLAPTAGAPAAGSIDEHLDLAALEATLTAMKGVGWTTETLVSLMVAIGSGGITPQQVRDAMLLAPTPPGTPIAGSIDQHLDLLDADTTEILTRVPDATPGGAGGLPTVDASNMIAGIHGTKKTLDNLNDIPAGSQMDIVNAPNAAAIATIQAGLALASTFTTPLADSVPADGAYPTIPQALYMMVQYLFEREVINTTMTIKKPDGTTALMTITLNDAISPTAHTRTT